MQAITGARIFTGDAMRDGHALLIEAGRVVAVVPESAVPASARRVELAGGLLAPGFIDLQVNGGGGVLLSATPTIEAIATIARAHRRHGTTGLLPTLISGPPAVTAAAILAIQATTTPGILGLHVEGPHFNPSRRGVHDPAMIRPITPADLDLLTSLPRSVGRTLVTLAPEMAPAGAIRHLAKRGVIVSAGHTDATFADIARALDEGLTSFTHLFNAMSQPTVREPGAVGAALDHGASFAGLIADGHHVHPANLRLALAAKGADRLCLVTDAMPPTGTAMASFELDGRRIHRQGGRLTAADGTLAGADIDMASSVKKAVELLRIPLESALRMASLTPAACLGLDHEHGRLAPGWRADMVHLDEALEVRECWIAGRTMAEDGLG
jgi:N-acetylglucosamine-6-phosphate deacetylase